MWLLLTYHAVIFMVKLRKCTKYLRMVGVPVGIRKRHVPMGCRYGKYIVTCRGDYRRGMHWWMDLLATDTHDSDLQVITAPPLISTIHKSPQHPLSLFESAVSSPAVPWQRLIIVEILQHHEFRSSCLSLQCRTDYQLKFVSCLCLGTNRIENIVLLLLRSCPLFTEPLHRNGRGSDNRKHPSSIVSCIT
jgi:hypothetical protein